MSRLSNKRYWSVFIVGLLVLCMGLVGCSNTETVEEVKKVPVSKTPVATQVKDVETELGGASSKPVEPGLLTKDKYKYEDYVNKEKSDFYRHNEIYLGKETQQKEDKYLLYFFSPLCHYCNAFYNTLKQYEKLPNAYPVYRVNVDVKENIASWDQYIQGTPTLILFNKKEMKVDNTVVGFVPIDQIPLRSDSVIPK